jgi:hypothetical protein
MGGDNMNTAMELIREIEAEGGAIILYGSSLRLIADEPLPAEIVEQVKVHKWEVIESLLRQTIPDSLTRPGELGKMEGWLVDLWRLVVWSAMEGPNKRTREEAEAIAWKDVDRERDRQARGLEYWEVTTPENSGRM